MIPMTAPHEQPDEKELNNHDFWKENSNALFARWTTEFDCEEETNWWYIIKDAPFDIETLSSSSKKHIRQSLKKVCVEKINPKEYCKDLCRVYNNACDSYKIFTGTKATEQSFCNADDNTDYWGIFSLDDNILTGYMRCRSYDDYTETVTAKYDPQYLKLRGSDAVHYTVCEYYLNTCGKKYISSGPRSINHVTNAQEYKIKNFGFRKAYCRLHIKYNPKIGWIIKLIYPFRKLLKKFDKIGVIHLINAVLKMEEICRGKENDE